MQILLILVAMKYKDWSMILNLKEEIPNKIPNKMAHQWTTKQESIKIFRIQSF